MRHLPRNPSRPRSVAIAAVLCVGLVVAACSGSSTPTTSPAAAGSSATPASVAPAASTSGSAGPAASGSAACAGAGVVFCGHVAITGGVAVSSDFVSSVFFLTCADWLKGKKDDPTMLTLPIALVGDLNTDIVIEHYTGPGSYDIADLVGNLGGFQVAVKTDVFNTDSKTSGSATLAADGSGSVTAKGLVPAGSANVVQQPVDLALTGTCYTK